MQKQRSGFVDRRGWLAGLILGMIAGTAALAAPATEAELQDGGGASRPWAQGVSAQQQEKAAALFREANALLRESLFAQAAQRYAEALQQWNHPAIHYNLALALLSLDRPGEVHGHLTAAMRYGPAPLDQDKFEHAKSYRTLVEKSLAKVEVTCEEPGATVTMDGAPLFVAPGRYEGWVRAGPHTVTAAKAGYETTNVSRALAGGEIARVALKLYTVEELTQYRRRWTAWKPWTVVAAGAAAALAGGALQLQAKDSFRSFDADVEACQGCVPGPAVMAKYDRGTRMQRLAVGSYVLGGAALATGATLVYLNRSIPYRVNPSLEAERTVQVVPVLSPDTGGLVATLRF